MAPTEMGWPSQKSVNELNRHFLLENPIAFEDQIGKFQSKTMKMFRPEAIGEIKHSQTFNSNVEF